MLFSKLWELCRQIAYAIRARIEDWRIGKVSVNRLRETRYSQLGAHDTQSTDYRMLDTIFKSFPLKPDDVFLDVGCGEGRVLTYLYLRKFKGKLIGIELDPEVAETARMRTKKCPNITIVCGNVLCAQDILSEVTAVYLFNPFTEDILKEFLSVVEECRKQPLILYYCCDYFRRVLDKRDRWTILRRGLLRRPGACKLPYSVYRFAPGESDH